MQDLLITQREEDKNMEILPTGGSDRSQQKKKLVNGKKTCSPSLGTLVVQAVMVGVTAIPTPSPHLRANRVSAEMPKGFWRRLRRSKAKTEAGVTDMAIGANVLNRCCLCWIGDRQNPSKVTLSSEVPITCSWSS